MMRYQGLRRRDGFIEGFLGMQARLEKLFAFHDLCHAYCLRQALVQRFLPLPWRHGHWGGPLRIMRRHVFPNAVSTLVVIATLYIANAIRTEAGLSFLGLGVPLPTASWGNILSEGRQFIQCCPWLTTFSGLAMMVTVLAFNLMGDALRDVLDPRLRGA